MVARHILFAGLFATASLANAALVEPTAAAGAPQAAWTFNAGTAPQAAPSDAFQVMMAGPGKWTGFSRMGDRGATSTMLFSQKSFGTAPAQAAAPAAAVEAAPATAAAAPVLEAPAVDAAAGASAAVDTSGLVNAGVGVGADVKVNVGGVAPAAVPEPATGMLMLAGLLGAGALTRRRK